MQCTFVFREDIWHRNWYIGSGHSWHRERRNHLQERISETARKHCKQRPVGEIDSSAVADTCSCDWTRRPPSSSSGVLERTLCNIPKFYSSQHSCRGVRGRGSGCLNLVKDEHRRRQRSTGDRWPDCWHKQTHRSCSSGCSTGCGHARLGAPVSATWLRFDATAPPTFAKATGAKMSRRQHYYLFTEDNTTSAISHSSYISFRHDF